MSRAAQLSCWLLLTMIATPALGAAADGAARVKLLARDNIAFAPASGQELEIAFELAAPGEVTIDIYSPDRDLIRSLRGKGQLAVGRHAFKWDGRDDRGQLVPDEAYHPVLSYRGGPGERVTLDPRVHTGGVVLERLQTDLAADGGISYFVPEPARVLVRVGIKGGAMMRALETWSAKAPGRARLKWDGYDASHAVQLLGKPRLTALVTAFSLPEHTILSQGNGALDYFRYREARGWKLPLVNLEGAKLERAGQRLSRQSALPRSALQDPRVTLRVVEESAKRPDGSVLAAGPLTFRVEIPQQDQWLLQQSLYEIGFFLDQQFVSEEETGYTPLHWRWVPNQLTPGPHTMTVNVSGLWGQVGVASVRLFVEQPK